MWTRCVAWRWKEARRAQVEQWVRQQSPSGAVQRAGNEVNRFKVAERIACMVIHGEGVEHGLHRWFR